MTQGPLDSNSHSVNHGITQLTFPHTQKPSTSRIDMWHVPVLSVISILKDSLIPSVLLEQISCFSLEAPLVFRPNEPHQAVIV
jgi:hypothetical protein